MERAVRWRARGNPLELLWIVVALVLVCQGEANPMEDPDQASAMLDKALIDSGWKRSASGSVVSIPRVGELFEGDIVMSGPLRTAVLGQTKRAALQAERYLWPNGVLPFVIAKGMPADRLNSIAEAIAHIHLATCIRLKPRIHQVDYIEFDWKSNACSSSVGRQGGKQRINIGRNCLVFGHVIHEIMHALGFIHEHSRPDRDDYIKILYENIKPGQRANFEKYSLMDIQDETPAYNFDSVMEYPNDAFSINGKPTILSKNDPSRVFGQRTHFDQGDIDQINRLYRCKRRKRKKHYSWGK